MLRFINTVLICLLAFLPTLSNAQIPSSASSIQVHGLTLHDMTVSILLLLSKKYKVVVGIYGVLIGDDSKQISVAVPEGTLKDVLDKIVQQDPRFEWQEKAGAIHVTTRDSPLPLLDVNVSSFDSENPPRLDAIAILDAIPETNAWLRQHDCRMSEIIAGYLPPQWPRFSVHVKDSTLSAIFDMMAAKSETYFWSVIEYRKQPCLINAYP